MVTEKESFRRARGTSNQIDKRFALNLSPLVRLLPCDQGVPLISVPVFITVKEMLTWFDQHLEELL